MVAHSALIEVPYLQQIHTVTGLANNHNPSSTICLQTPAPLLSRPQFPPFCKSQLTWPTHNIVLPLPIVSTCQFRGNKREQIWLLQGIERGLQCWDFDVITTMIPTTAGFQILQLIYPHYHRSGLYQHLSTRWTEQTRLTNSQATTHESWLVRCSSCTPGFSREQSGKDWWVGGG